MARVKCWMLSVGRFIVVTHGLRKLAPVEINFRKNPGFACLKTRNDVEATGAERAHIHTASRNFAKSLFIFRSGGLVKTAIRRIG